MSEEIIRDESVGRLYLNTAKNGKQYLRGIIGGVNVVGFKGRESESFVIFRDNRKDERKDRLSFTDVLND